MSGNRRRLLRRMANHQRPDPEPRPYNRTRASGVMRRRTAKRRRAAEVAATLCVSGVKHCDWWPECHHQAHRSAS